MYNDLVLASSDLLRTLAVQPTSYNDLVHAFYINNHETKVGISVIKRQD